ncbi:MAG: phosphomannomutase/phosphoglucomutase [Pseudomonadales bacterium]|nr:phosphomannomutase/phosphoglucomutase [Pseudomonadales bacterium]
MLPSAHIFRAYDIRGIVGAKDGLDVGVMALLGRAIASEALDHGQQTLVVAADARLSSPAFIQAMIEGILASGCHVINIGTVPTPVLYFATHVLETASGVMITGSHNPGHYNGVKIVLQRSCLAAHQIQRLYARIQSGDFHSGNGTCQILDIQDTYIARISADIRLDKNLKVVVDAGNGVTGLLAPRLFRALGCEVLPLYCEPDGNFPHHHPDPSQPTNLRDLRTCVLAAGADLGVAFDGDGDRVALISAQGNIIDADKLLMTFAQDILPDEPGAKIIYDVKSSRHLPRLIERAGGQALMCRSGHSFVKQKMQESGALLGGEYSAHIFFKHRWYGFDDGLYAAARFLELMTKNKRPAEAFLQRLPSSVSTSELFVPVADDRKFALVTKLQQDCRLSGALVSTLDGVRADFPGSWGLVRASNTTPALVLRFEADTVEDLDAIMALFRQELLRLAPELVLTF